MTTEFARATGSAAVPSEVAIGEPRHLAEGLVREVIGAAILEVGALDPGREPGLFERPMAVFVAGRKAANLLGSVGMRR